MNLEAVSQNAWTASRGGWETAGVVTLKVASRCDHSTASERAHSRSGGNGGPGSMNLDCSLSEGRATQELEDFERFLINAFVLG